MAKLVILGSSNAVPDEQHENTHMALVGDEHTLLIDCVHPAILRLKRAGIAYDQVTGVLLTHFHPDHVSGVPSFLMESWLLGRKAPLQVYGLAHTLDRMEALMQAYDWLSWPDFYPVTFSRLPAVELTPVLDNPEFRLFSSPVRHLIPNVGLRIEMISSGKVIAYSCDTQPCSEVVRLASGADLLIHEASGAHKGHTSAFQAGEVAAQAGAAELMLIHYRTGGFDASTLVQQAQASFNGKVSLATDFQEIRL